MKRQNILIAACCLAAVSLGGNIWLLMHRNKAPGPAPQQQEKTPPALPTAAEFDFSDTAFADGSWKLSDEEEPPVSLDKSFSFEEFKAPPEAEIPRDSSGPGIRSSPVNRGREKFTYDFFDYGDTPPNSPPLQK